MFRFSLIFTLITLLLLAAIGYVVIVPANVWRVNQACDGVEQTWVSPLTPSARVLEESNPAADQSGQRTLLAEPVYLEVTPPRPFAQARISLEVQNLPMGQKFSLGVISQTEVFSPSLGKTDISNMKDGWQLASAQVSLTDIHQTPNGSYKFLISAPGFTDRIHYLPIRHCTIEFSGWPTLWQLAQRYGVRLLNNNQK